MGNRITILATSDLHGMIFPYSYADGKQTLQGLARIKTLIDQRRDASTILIDNGDVIEGSPFTCYHYTNRADRVCPVSLAMKRIGYDFSNVGNHDFNYGEEKLFDHIKATGSLCLTANVFYKGNPLGPDYVIRSFDDVRVALFAVTTHFVPYWEKAENIADFRFEDAFTCAERIVKEIKEKEDPDFIVCIYHGGLERDPESGEASETQTGENQGYRMMKEIEGIDVLLMGHQHRVCCGKAFKTAYVQPGFEATLLASIEIDTESKEITPSLIPVDAPADPEILKLAQEEEEEVQHWLDTPLGFCDMDLRIHDELDARIHKSQLATFFNLVQREVTGAQLSGSAIFLRATGFFEEITMRDLISTYRFPNTLVVKRISGRILKEYLEQNARFWTLRDNAIAIDPLYDFPTPQHHNYDMVDGDLEYEITVSRPAGQRITKLLYQGREVKEEDEFTLAINNYRASGGGGFGMLREAETVKEIQRSVIDILADYIRSHPHIHFERIDNIHVTI